MRDRSQRRSALEAAVFVAALLLAVFIARELWTRRSAAHVVPPPVMAVNEPAVVEPLTSHPSSVHRTELAVSGVAPLKLNRVRRRKPKPVVIPAPR